MSTASKDWTKLVDRLVLLLAVSVLLLIPLKIMSYGYLPPDDALRHAAKAVCGKPWTEIILMRPDLTVDHHVGWHRALGWLHLHLNWTTDDLVAFSIVVLPLTILLSGLLDSRRRPEAWILALLAVSLMSAPVYRWMLARPFVLSMGALTVVLILWTRKDWNLRFPLRIALAAVPIALATWIHGSCWYLFPLVVASFLVARQWREAGGVASSWIIGTLAGAFMTGEPITFLWGHLKHMLLALGSSDLTRLLVTEFQPSDGVASALILAAFVLVVRRLHFGPGSMNGVLRDPVFITAAIGWILGLKVTRFWMDWGIPALTLWLAREIRCFTADWTRQPWPRLAGTAFGTIALFWVTTSDLGGRWTGNLTTEYIETENPHLAGWLPEPGGIIYSDSMTLFYQTFYKNPNAPWRYALAYEPALMPPEDLAIYRKIQWNYHADKAFAPWVEKMRPQDRLILPRSKSSPPDIQQLEWTYGVTGTWIGRLPKKPGTQGYGETPDIPSQKTPAETQKAQ